MKRMVAILLLSVFTVCFGAGYLLSVKQAEATLCCGSCSRPCKCVCKWPYYVYCDCSID